MHCAETINGKKGGVLYFCWPSSAFIKKTHKTKKQNENKQPKMACPFIPLYNWLKFHEHDWLKSLENEQHSQMCHISSFS